MNSPMPAISPSASGDGTPIIHTASVDSTPIRTISINWPTSQRRSASPMPSMILAACACARGEEPDQAVGVGEGLRRQIDGADDHDDHRFKESRADFQETGEDARHRD